MSTKVAFSPVKPTWKDATTLGQLELMIQALYGFGYDVDTPVTYLYDDDHVWLETVHEVPEDTVVVLDEPKQPSWAHIQDVPDGVYVVNDAHGDKWHSYFGQAHWRRDRDGKRSDSAGDYVGPFTEAE